MGRFEFGIGDGYLDYPPLEPLSVDVLLWDVPRAPNADPCASHADCKLGAYCDVTQHCWTCASLSDSWCDIISCDTGQPDQRCGGPSCCNSAELLAHCPPADWPNLLQVSEKDTELAQELGRLQPFIAVFPQECMGQLASFGPT